MAQKQKQAVNNTRHLLLRITRVHFLYVAAYALSIILFDSWNLLTHEAALQRWTAVGALLVVNTIIWYLCKSKINNEMLYKVLLVVLLVCDIIFAAMNVYWQRGMASKSVVLFFVPIVSASLVKSRSLLLATASLSTVAYMIACIQYFYTFFNEGFRVELYGEIALYSLLFFVLAGLLMINFRSAKD